MSRAAVAHAATFSWDHTVDALLASYGARSRLHRRAASAGSRDRASAQPPAVAAAPRCGRMTSRVQSGDRGHADEASELTYSHHEGAHGGPPGLIVELPGERKLKTNTILSIGEHSVRVEAFVCRKPDENHEGVYRFLLKRNRRLYGVAYTLDNVGDIYLVGRMALASVTPTRSTGCSDRCSRRSTRTSTRCWSWVFSHRSRRSGRGGCRAASR